MAVNRVLYATQVCKIQSTNYTMYLPVQTASADETIPQDDVLVMGKIGGVARVQKDVASTKCSVKAFIAHDGKFQGGSTWINGRAQDLDVMLTDLELDATQGTMATITVDSTGTGTTGTNDEDGFLVKGILNNISLDASKGAFPMLDLSFEGVGRMDTLNLGTGATLADAHGGSNSLKSVTPLVSTDVSLGSSADTNDTINSVKFAFDLPTETLSRLGGLILGDRDTVDEDNGIFSKPPYKATMTVDGQSVDSVNTQWGSASADTMAAGIGVQFKKGTGANEGFAALVNYAGAAVSSRSFSQNVGDVGATFSVSAEGTDASFITA
jgi:hypothetical protein